MVPTEYIEGSACSIFIEKVKELPSKYLLQILFSGNIHRNEEHQKPQIKRDMIWSFSSSQHRPQRDYQIK